MHIHVFFVIKKMYTYFNHSIYELGFLVLNTANIFYDHVGLRSTNCQVVKIHSLSHEEQRAVINQL